MPYRIKGIAGLRYTDEEMSVAGLTPDGMHVQAWVTVPTGKVWKPEDLLWLPPSATKSTDIDRAGSIVDVTLDIGETRAWVTAQLAKHERYLDLLRSKVRAGALRLNAALAKMLGLHFEDGAELVPRSVPYQAGPQVAMKAAADLEAAIGRTWRDEPAQAAYQRLRAAVDRGDAASYAAYQRLAAAIGRR